MSVKAMFHNAVGSEPSSLVQHQAYAYACRTQDTELLARLVRVKNLDPELEAVLARRSEIEVISGWLGRPGRTREQVVERLKSERRATLLGDLARESGLPDDIYQHLFSTGSVQVSWELLCNKAVPRQMRIDCAHRLAQGFTLRNRGVDDKLKPLARLDEELWGEFVSHMSNGWALARLVEVPSLGMASFERAVVVARSAARLVTAVSPASVRSDDNVSCALRAASSLLDRLEDLTLDQLDELEGILRPACEHVAGISAGHHCALTYKRRRERLQHDLTEALDWVRSSSSAVELASRSQSLRQSMQDMSYTYREVRDLVGEAVLQSDALSADLLRNERVICTEVDDRRVFALALRRADRDLALEILNIARSHRVDLVSEAYASQPDPKGMLEWLIGDAEHPPVAILSAQVVRSDVELALSMLPASSTLANPALAGRISAELEAAFGDQSDKWDAFVALSPEWTGSFRSLVATVNTV